uniref:Uncharacterized protein n=1 Tax=Oryza brachyantha TaxID=4533 RepID=J3LQX8_ORYBR
MLILPHHFKINFYDIAKYELVSFDTSPDETPPPDSGRTTEFVIAINDLEKFPQL